jgi:hypothetical protein
MKNPDRPVSCPQQSSEDEKYDPEKVDEDNNVGKDLIDHLPIFYSRRKGLDSMEMAVSALWEKARLFSPTFKVKDEWVPLSA